jgi:hypothetical protein
LLRTLLRRLLLLRTLLRSLLLLRALLRGLLLLRALLGGLLLLRALLGGLLLLRALLRGLLLLRTLLRGLLLRTGCSRLFCALSISWSGLRERRRRAFRWWHRRLGVRLACSSGRFRPRQLCSSRGPWRRSLRPSTP